MSDIKSRDTHGQAAVFAAVATRMRPALLATAMGYLHDADDADDAVQEALMRCWMTRSRMHDLTSDLPPMMQTVVRNVCIDHLRLRKHNIPIYETSEASPDGSNINSHLSIVNSQLSPDRLQMGETSIPDHEDVYENGQTWDEHAKSHAAGIVGMAFVVFFGFIIISLSLSCLHGHRPRAG